ncbi:MAG: hypothetical protein LBJ70_04380 [Holosporales bacterium]|jgi:hypothetical protein|nr:hypothetical protein [Holosporales bacterium]
MAAYGSIQRHFFRKKDKSTMIFGTSMAGNILRQEAEQLGGFDRAINVSLCGMGWDEMIKIYDIVLKSPVLRTVVQSLDGHFFQSVKMEMNFQGGGGVGTNREISIVSIWQFSRRS